MPPISAISLVVLASVGPLLDLRGNEAWLAGCTSLFVLAAAFAAPRLLPGLVGASLALLPFAGPNTISLILGAYLLVTARSFSPRHLQWAAPALLFLAGAVCLETCRMLLAPGGPFFEGVATTDLQRLGDLARSALGQQVTTFGLLSRATLFALLVGHLSNDADDRRRFIRGLLVGLTIASTIALLYSAGLDSVALRTQTPFWTKLNRVSSTLSDPNSLGVMVGLGLWLAALSPSALPTRHPIRVFVCLLLVAAGLVSGSRTFVLSLLLLLGSLAWIRSRSLALVALVLAGCAFLAINIADSTVASWRSWVVEGPGPEAARRVIQSLTVAQWPEAFFSRSVFTQISARMVSEHPWYGIGADRYRDYIQLVSSQLRLGIGSWSDNANNFYLGLLAELGVVGFVVATATALSRRFAPGCGPLPRFAVLSLALVLATGPHVEFSEVAAATAVVVACCTVAAPRRALTAPIAALAIFALGMPAALHERGVFEWRARSTEVSRLLSPSADIEVLCPAGLPSIAEIPLRVPVGVPGGPVSVTAFGGGKPIASGTIQEQGGLDLKVPCPRSGKSIVSLRFSPPWSPHLLEGRNSGDRRIFGARQVATESP